MCVWRLTFEGREFLQLAVVAEAEAGGAWALVLLDGRLRAALLALQQLRRGRDAVTALPVGTLRQTGCHTQQQPCQQPSHTHTANSTLFISLTS